MSEGSDSVIAIGGRRWFGPKEVCAIVGISYRQLQYWDKSGLVCPSDHRLGRFRNYSREDLVRVKLFWMLRRSGIRTIQQIRSLLPRWRELELQAGPALFRAQVVAIGRDLFLFERFLGATCPVALMLDIPQFLRNATGESEVAA